MIPNFQANYFYNIIERGEHNLTRMFASSILYSLQTKSPQNEFTTLILKARGPRRGALG